MDNTDGNFMGPGALRRGLHILNALRDATSDGLSVAQISIATGIHRPTVYRLLDVLQQERYVRCVVSGRRYVLSSPDERPLDDWETLSEQLKPCIKKIAAETGNSVFLIRQDGADAICLHRELGSYPIQVVSLPIGGRLPLGVGAAGVAYLAALDNSATEKLLTLNEPRFHEYGMLNRKTVELLISNAKARGYSVVGNYALRGVLGVGIAVYDRTDRPVASIGVTAIVDRMTDVLQRKTAKTIQRELGRIAGFFNHNTII